PKLEDALEEPAECTLKSAKKLTDHLEKLFELTGIVEGLQTLKKYKLLNQIQINGAKLPLFTSKAVAHQPYPSHKFQHFESASTPDELNKTRINMLLSS